MAGHGGGNMVGQTTNQGQFLAQTQFPTGAAVTATGALNVTVGTGMGQAPAQAAVTQVGGRPTIPMLLLRCCVNCKLQSAGGFSSNDVPLSN